MKLITLNAWGGKVKEPFTKFIREHSDTDVFCFQEVFHDATTKSRADFVDAHLELYDHLRSLLPNHTPFFCPTVDDYYGIATFIKKDLGIQASGDVTIYDNPQYPGTGGNHGRKMLWHEITGGKLGNATVSIFNVHGLWNGKGKTDTPERIEQSRRIKEFMDNVSTPKILCGDFNLLPDTESLAMLAHGMQNMVKEYGVVSTRTSFYTRADTSGRFADYVFASPEIKVTDFEVMPDEISDHAALFVEFDLK